MMHSPCPLCVSNENNLIEIVKKTDLLALYKKITGRKFDKIINQDTYLYSCHSCDLKYFSPPLQGDENFYNSLQSFKWYYLENKIEYAFAQKYLEKNNIVLDVGCGKGAFAKYVLESGANFIGLDFSINAREIARQKGIEVKQQSIQDYSCENPESVDVVTSFQVIEHIASIKSFIEAKLQVLKPNGKMIIAVPSEDSFLSVVTNSILNMPPHHISRWPDITLQYISKYYSLELIDFYHEPLQDIHKLFYLNTFIQNSFMHCKLIDRSFNRYIICKIARIFSRLLLKGLTPSMLPDGHTVVAVYVKK